MNGCLTRIGDLEQKVKGLGEMVDFLMRRANLAATEPKPDPAPKPAPQLVTSQDPIEPGWRALTVGEKKPRGYEYRTRDGITGGWRRWLTGDDVGGVVDQHAAAEYRVRVLPPATPPKQRWRALKTGDMKPEGYQYRYVLEWDNGAPKTYSDWIKGDDVGGRINSDSQYSYRAPDYTIWQDEFEKAARGVYGAAAHFVRESSDHGETVTLRLSMKQHDIYAASFNEHWQCDDLFTIPNPAVSSVTLALKNWLEQQQCKVG
jgi:hypothetical protein